LSRIEGGPELITLGRPELDVTRIDTLETAFAVHEPCLVVNCAAYTGVDTAESEEQQVMAVNAEGAHAVAKLCAFHAIPIIHISTDYVFDGTKSQPYCETDPTGPTGVYGLSKLLGEDGVAETCPRHIILRTAWVYSPFGHNFVKTMLRLADERNDISVVNDQFGCPTYAPHLAEAILEVAHQIVVKRSPQAPWGIYHAAGAGETNWFDFAREVFKHSARYGGPSAKAHPISTADYPTPAKRPANSRLNCSALKDRFAVALPDWRMGVEPCVGRLLETNSRLQPAPVKSGDPI